MRSILFAVAAAFVLAPGGTLAVEPVFPGETWRELDPAEAGLDEAKLEAFARVVGGRGCVVRYGYLVYTWGDYRRRGDVASAAKPWYSHFLFKAVEEGRIESLDERLVKWAPRLGKINAALGHKDREITWRHCANQTSCYQLAEKPGEAYAYNDWQMALFWDTLFGKVYSASYENVDEKVLRPMLADPLQCEDRPTFMAFGTENRPGRLAVSPRDFCRFGLLYLRGGEWKGQRLLSAEHARMAVADPVPNHIPRAGREAAEMIPGQRSMGSRSRPDNQTEHFGAYSWLWWINGVDARGESMWPDAPRGTFGAFGHGGPRAMWVVPELDLVVSYNDSKVKGWSNGAESPTNRAMKLLVDSVVDKKRDSPDQNAAREPATEQRDRPKPGSYAKWQEIELRFAGPPSRGRGEPNPFAISLDVVFTGPSGKTYRVPGFYDGDGQGGLDGDVWKVRFSADEEGDWTWRSESPHERLDDESGRFRVTPVPDDAGGFWKLGRLEYTGTPENGLRYLKFRDGPFWLKAGCDDPENFLGAYRNYDTLAKRQAAIDFLAERGINSLYIMTHNLGGDDKDVWPWLGGTAREAMSHGGEDARFDVARLDSWRRLFEHMQDRGVVPYLVLEDDSAWKGYDRRPYYREMIARFGYLPALLFNMGEEHNENYRLSEALDHMKLLAETDPYDHPRGIHNVNRPNDEYIDAEHIDFTAIQTGSPGRRRSLDYALQHNRIALEWIARCRSRDRRVLMVNFDEGRPEEDRRAWWSAYLAGAVWEAHVREPYDRPHSVWSPLWKELGGTRAFMESLPFWRMAPDNDLVRSGQAFCLAESGKAYAFYLPTGGTIEVQLPAVSYDAAWWNPANGRDGQFGKPSAIEGGRRQFTAPDKGDWALRVTRQ